MKKNQWFKWLQPILFLLILAACGSQKTAVDESGIIRGDQLELSGQATLFCSSSCAAYGQCGTQPQSGENLILLNHLVPAAQQHTFAWKEGTTVDIQYSFAETILNPASDSSFALFYYLVHPTLQPELPSAWVPGWCIKTP